MVQARKVMVDTPFGRREGLEVDDPYAPRLFPAAQTDEFRSVKTVTVGGVQYDLVWENDIPYVCQEHGVTERTVSLVTMRVKESSRRTLKHIRKRARRRLAAEVEEEEWDAPRRDHSGLDSPYPELKEGSEAAASVNSEEEADEESFTFPGELDFTGLFTNWACSGLGGDRHRLITDARGVANFPK